MHKLLPMDIHSHSAYSFDGLYPVASMCEAALAKGIGIYAITDHYDISVANADYTVLDAGLAGSFTDACAAKARCQDALVVLPGIELGQPLDDLPKAEEILSAYAFDYVIGAMHNAPDSQDFYYYSPENESFHLEKELEAYYTAFYHMACWGRFDCAAHLTYPFRYVRQHHDSYPFGKWDDYLDAIVRRLAENGLAMEINTSGWKYDPPYAMPDSRWVKRFRELGGEMLTLGADSHEPDHVGLGIAEGLQIAVEAGFSRLCYFEDRQPVWLAIDGLF